MGLTNRLRRVLEDETHVTGRILIIDDEDRILQFVARGLRTEGYEVDVCADPHAGLEAA